MKVNYTHGHNRITMWLAFESNPTKFIWAREPGLYIDSLHLAKQIEVPSGSTVAFIFEQIEKDIEHHANYTKTAPKVDKGQDTL